MSDIETDVRAMVQKALNSIGVGGGMKKLIVVVAAFVGAYMAYRWLRDNLEKVVE